MGGGSQPGGRWLAASPDTAVAISFRCRGTESGPQPLSFPSGITVPHIDSDPLNHARAVADLGGNLAYARAAAQRLVDARFDFGRCGVWASDPCASPVRLGGLVVATDLYAVMERLGYTRD